jgi:hypothetical protein
MFSLTITPTAITASYLVFEILAKKFKILMSEKKECLKAVADV